MFARALARPVEPVEPAAPLLDLPLVEQTVAERVVAVEVRAHAVVPHEARTHDRVLVGTEQILQCAHALRESRRRWSGRGGQRLGGVPRSLVRLASVMQPGVLVAWRPR